MPVANEHNPIYIVPKMQSIIFHSILKCCVYCLEHIRGRAGYKYDNNFMDLEIMYCDIHSYETEEIIFTENQDLLG